MVLCGPSRAGAAMKKVYRTTKIRPNGVDVSVRQVLGRGQDRIPAIIGEAASKARQWMVLAIAADPRTDSRTKSIFSHCFQHPGDSAAVSTVRATLGVINNSLSRAYAVKVNTDDGSTFGYVKRSYTGRPHLINGMVQFDEDGDAVTRRGEIHVCLLAADQGSDMAAITLIHEAGHKFANLRDHGNRGYFDSNNKTFCAPGLTWKEALWNADSYAVYCYKIAKAKGFIVDPRGEDENLDLSSLFG